MHGTGSLRPSEAAGGTRPPSTRRNPKLAHARAPYRGDEGSSRNAKKWRICAFGSDVMLRGGAACNAQGEGQGTARTEPDGVFPAPDRVRAVERPAPVKGLPGVPAVTNEVSKTGATELAHLQRHVLEIEGRLLHPDRSALAADDVVDDLGHGAARRRCLVGQPQGLPGPSASHRQRHKGLVGHRPTRGRVFHRTRLRRPLTEDRPCVLHRHRQAPLDRAYRCRRWRGTCLAQ